jgi:hypothetical protein
VVERRVWLREGHRGILIEARLRNPRHPLYLCPCRDQFRSGRTTHGRTVDALTQAEEIGMLREYAERRDDAAATGWRAVASERWTSELRTAGSRRSGRDNLAMVSNGSRAGLSNDPPVCYRIEARGAWITAVRLALDARTAKQIRVHRAANRRFCGSKCYIPCRLYTY